MIIYVPNDEKQAKAIIEAEEYIMSYHNSISLAQKYAQRAMHILIQAGIDPEIAIEILKGKCQIDPEIAIEILKGKCQIDPPVGEKDKASGQVLMKGTIPFTPAPDLLKMPVVVESDELLPERKTTGAAGFDLRIKESVTLIPGATQLVGTGVRAAIPEGHVGLVFIRSGMASSHNLEFANKVAVIDSDYRGEIKLALRYTGNSNSVTIEAGTRVAQLVILPLTPIEIVKALSLDETERGEGGFGSTGTN